MMHYFIEPGVARRRSQPRALLCNAVGVDRLEIARPKKAMLFLSRSLAAYPSEFLVPSLLLSIRCARRVVVVN